MSNDSPPRRRPRLLPRLVAVSWRDLLVIFVPVLALATLLAWLAVKFLNPAPPGTIRMLSGPDGSSYRTTAEKYKKIIEAQGVRVEIVPSEGGLDNLKRLSDPSFKADVALVPGGLTDGIDISRLVSLGSLTPQPLMIYYRSARPIERLSEFKGKRLAIGQEGSGTHALALKLLAANGLDKSNTTLVDLAGEDAARALTQKSIDAAFLMGDSATPAVMRGLRAEPDIDLMNFRQANGYVRRFRFLSRLSLPEGSLDLGEDIPDKNYQLIGPTVELVARDGLHPALSDLLIGAAREIHGGPGMFRDAGEYPAPLQRDFPISADAERYYKSGSKFLYRQLPFWLASLVDRLLVIVLPLLVLIVPLTRIVPPVYRWRVRSRIYRWYGALMSIERDMLLEHTPEERQQILRRLERVEDSVNRLKTPLSFADQLYVLRSHISWVQQRLQSGNAQTASRASSTANASGSAQAGVA
jgi:hypothetical protein